MLLFEFIVSDKLLFCKRVKSFASLLYCAREQKPNISFYYFIFFSDKTVETRPGTLSLYIRFFCRTKFDYHCAC